MVLSEELAPLSELQQSYLELNSMKIEELRTTPSPLEFMRYVARNIPFVVRGGAKKWKAYKDWDKEYLERTMGTEMIEVAITPYGNADSPLTLDDGRRILAKPHTEMQSFQDFMAHITTEPLSADPLMEVRYAQTQNDNLRTEYVNLFKDVHSSVSWATEALEKEPEAINLWIGNAASVTALHRDPYENIYVVIRGSKEFVLLSGILWENIEEEWMGLGRYERDVDDRKLQIVVEDGRVPVATWDPDKLEKKGCVRVEVREGDILYLPALWYHKVSQRCDREGLCVAVNYWYDMEYSGNFYPTMQFVRNVGLQTG